MAVAPQLEAAASQPLDPPPYASLGRRLGAYAIDATIALIIALPVIGAINNPAGLYPLLLVVELAYFSFFEASDLGASPGKLVLGLRVVAISGEKLTLRRAFARSIAKLSTAGLAFFVRLIRGRPAWHDSLAGTAVLYRNRPASFPLATHQISQTRRRVGWAIVTALLALTLGLGLVRGFTQRMVIEGNAMAPTLTDQQHIWVERFSYLFASPHRGDLVSFRAVSAGQPDRKMIERVIGLPGENVSVADGLVYINGQPLREPYELQPPSYRWGPETVPAGDYFVLGDNRNDAFDSHDWTISPWVRRSDIEGKVW